MDSSRHLHYLGDLFGCLSESLDLSLLICFSYDALIQPQLYEYATALIFNSLIEQGDPLMKDFQMKITSPTSCYQKSKVSSMCAYLAEPYCLSPKRFCSY